MARVGILGGTFNPPHLGHLVCAQEALIALALDSVVLVPAGTPPHKEVPVDPGAEHRVALCEAAVAGDDRFSVSRVEVERTGASYSVDTLRALHEREPEHDLTFIVGGDMAHSFPEWREPEAILELAELGVAEREGVRRADIAERLSPLRGAAERVRFFDMPRLDISSSLIRRRAAAGRPVRYLVPRGVGEYILREGLYGAGAVAGAATGGAAVNGGPGQARMAAGEELAGVALAEAIAGYAADKKAVEVVELDLRGVLGYTDYFIVCSGNTERQTKAIHDGIHLGMKDEHGVLPRRVEGAAEARWILMDYLDVVVHVFTPEARDYYRLEQLWGEAPKRTFDPRND